MKRVLCLPNNSEIALAQSVLESAGIECEVRNDSVSQLLGAPFQSELWVRDEDFATATELLAAQRTIPPGEQ